MWFSFFVGLFGSIFYGSRIAGEKAERKKTNDLAQKYCDICEWWRKNVVYTEEGRNIIKYKISEMTREEIWEEVKEVYDDIFSKYDLTELKRDLNFWGKNFKYKNCYDYEGARAGLILDKDRATQIILAKHGLIDGRQGFPTMRSGRSTIPHVESCSLLNLLVRKWCTEELRRHNLDIKLRAEEVKTESGNSYYYWCWEIG